MRLFSGDNLFTRLMNQIGILFFANICFILCCLPVVTAGAGFSALYYTMLRSMRENGDIKPVKTFWTGLKENFCQATLSWLVLLSLAVLVYLEIFWCNQFTGPIMAFRYGLYAIGLVLAIFAVYLFPVIAAFRGTLPQLLKNCIGFAFSKPAVILGLLILNAVPMAWTFFTNAYLPLYAFLWCTVGFSGIAMLCSKMLLPLFSPYLKEETDCIRLPEKTEKQILEEMRKLDL